MKDNKIFGRSWEDIQRLQQRLPMRQQLKRADGDYGADPIGNGMFRMVPSGDVVDFEERTRRLRYDNE